MSVKIRLRRMGRTNKPFYRVVATDSRCSNSGRFLESLGWYDPDKPEPNFSLKIDRVDYWKDNGALLSDTVKSLVRKSRKGMGLAPESPEPVTEPAPAAEPATTADSATEGQPEATETEAQPEGATEEKPDAS